MKSLRGDLGATIAVDGAATLPLSTLHGYTVTNVTIPAAQAETVNATSIGAWSNYTEYGTPRDPAATAAVAARPATDGSAPKNAPPPQSPRA